MRATDKEKVKAIMNDAYVLLRDHTPVPKKGTKDDGFWDRFSDDLVSFASKWDNDQFAIEQGCAIWQYCEWLGGYKNEIGDEIK